MAVAEILGGVFLLVLGRKLFWGYLAIQGFIYGVISAATYFTTQPEWQKIAIGVCVGIAFALLAISFQKIGVILAGVSIGPSIVMFLFGYLFHQPDYLSNVLVWILMLIAAILGGVLAYKFFDWALIIFSSISGAALILTGLNLDAPQSWPMALGLILLGIITQAGIKKLPGRKKKTALENT